MRRRVGLYLFSPRTITRSLLVSALAVFALVLVVRESSVLSATADLLTSVPRPLVGISTAPRQSSPVALTSDDLKLINVNPEANTITIFDVSTDNPVKLAEVNVGRDPSSVAVHPDGVRAFVANSFDGTVSVVNLSSNTVSTTFSVGVEPMAVALSPNGTRLYVANSASNSLGVYNTAGTPPSAVAIVDLSAFGTAPRAIAVTNDGDGDDTDETIFVAEFFSQLRPGKTAVDEGQDDQREGHVVALSAATNTVLGGPNPVVLGPISSAGFNSNGALLPANGITPAVPSTNPQSFTTPTAAFPNQLAAIAIHPIQSRTYIVSTGASPNGPFRFNHMAQGLVSVFDTTTRAEITAAQTDPTVRRTAPLNINQGINLATTPAPRLFMTNPVAMVWRPDGSDAWIAIQNSDVIVRLTVDAGGIPTVAAPLVAGPSPIVRVDLSNPPSGIPGKAPQGIAINSSGTRAFVHNFVSRSISVVNISNPTAPVVAGTALSTALPAPGSMDATALLGAELFYSGRGPQDRMSSESWGGCVVCHPKGRSDNVTWMFDAGPRQTIPLDGMFDKSNPSDQRILNWSAVRDENHDFELNTRGIFGGRGLIDDDRLFLAIAGANGATPTDSALIEQFQQFTGATTTTNDLVAGATLPSVLEARRDFAIATLGDDRIFIIGGRSGAGQGNLISGTNAVLEFNPRTNVITPVSSAGFTSRHSLGAAAVKTSGGPRIYAVGGYASTSSSASPVSTVEEYNPATNTWRTVASLPQATAQFAITVAGGINTADPRELIHVIGGNAGSEGTPSLVSASFNVQRFQADPVGPGVWANFSITGLTIRRNHGAATALRGVAARIFVIGGQDAGGTVLSTVEEYTNATVPAAVLTPHTTLPAPRARFGIGSTLTTNQIYVMGGIDSGGADQTSVFEYSIGNNGPVAGPPGTPSGSWVTRSNISVARSGLQVSTPPGVTNFLPVKSAGRDLRQDAIAVWIAKFVRSSRGAVQSSDPNAVAGKALFDTVGLVIPGFSCASCHGGPKFTISRVDYTAPPSPATGLGLGNEQVIGAELRQTQTQPAVLTNVGTFTPNSPGGRVNEIRFNAADISQAIAPLGANGFNIPSLLSVNETPPYFYSGLAQTLDDVLNGSQDGNGGVRHHFVTNATQRAQLVSYLRSIEFVVPSDLSVTKADTPDPVTAGTNLTYTFAVSNAGPGDADNVSITDVIPTSTTFVSFQQNSGPAFTLTTPPVGGTGTVTATAATLASGASATFTLVVNVNANTPNGSTLTNTATVSTSGNDPTGANNSDTETTAVNTQADLSVTKSDSPDPVSPGDDITYTIVITNAGPSDAQNLQLTDNIPANTTFLSAFQTSGPAFTLTTPPSGSGGTVTATIPSFAAGATATFTLMVHVVNNPSGATISNTASVTSVTTDPNTANNSDTETTGLPAISINDVSILEGNSGSSAAVFTVILSAPNPQTVTVDFFTANGTATEPSDYTAVNGTITFTPMQTSRTISVPVNGDTLPEGDETFFVNLTNPSNAPISDPQGVGTIIDDDPGGTLQFFSATFSAAENSGSALITVNRIGSAVGTVTVNFSTSNGTAIAGSDYGATSGTLTFGPGVTSQSFAVPLLDDNISEGTESVNLTLSGPTGGGTLGSQSTAILLILDNESPPADSVNVYAVTLNNNLLTFNSAAPQVILSTIPITGLQPAETVLAIDFRPATGQLFGLGSTSRLYTINTSTGAATAIAGPFTPSLSGSDFGSDFNPTVDRLRVVSDSDQNLRLNPSTGALTATDSTLSYASGDLNFGANPNVVGSAYTNSFAGSTVTTLYGIDSNLDTLVRQGSANGTPVSPNTGLLTTIGSLGVSTNGLVGFDIQGSTNRAFASLTTPGDSSSKLYNLNLGSGAASLIGTIGGPDLIRDITVAASAFEFSAATASVGEGGGHVTLTVTRTGNTSVPATVDFATSDGSAKQVSDYTIALGTLQFAAGEVSKTIDIFIIDDVYVEGDETFSVNLSSPSADSVVSGVSTVTITINDNDTVAPTTNPIDDAQFFVRQQYLDFLNREPEPGGLAFWTSQITACGADATCINRRRVEVSAAFFGSPEFQETGGLVFRTYKAGLNRQPTYLEFMRDRSLLPAGPGLESAKVAFFNNFVLRPEFLTLFPTSLTPAQYVDGLNANTGNSLTPAQRDALVTGLTNSTETRATVLRKVAENAAFSAQQANPAFVLMEYFGYLRRDADPGGQAFWLNVLNSSGNFRGMVCAFLTSAEYQARFSPIRTRTDVVCAGL